MSRRRVLFAAVALATVTTACEYVSPDAGNPSAVAVATDATFCWDVRAEQPSELVLTWGDGGSGTVVPFDAEPVLPVQREVCESHRWGREGTYVVDATLVPVDSPYSARDTSVVVVGDPEPIVVAPAAVRGTPLTVDATGAVVALGGDPHTALVDWVFGDGVVSVGRSRIVTHVWEVPRTFTVSVTVRAADGTVLGTHSQSLTIADR